MRVGLASSNGGSVGGSLRNLAALSAMTVGMAAGYVLIGGFLALTGPILPSLRSAFGIGLAQSGAVFVAHGLGALAAVVTAGVLADRIGRKPVVVVSMALFLLGLALLSGAGSWAGALAAFAVTGAGFGSLDVSLNALVIDLYPRRRSLALNLLHLFFAVGAVVTPLWAARVLEGGAPWQGLFRTLAFGAVIDLLLIAGVRPAAPAPQQSGTVDRPGATRARGRRAGGRAPAAGRGKGPAAAPAAAWVGRVVWVLGAVLTLYVGVEVSITGWSYTYVLEQLGGEPALAGAAVSVFWLGLSLGRLAAGPISERLGYGISVAAEAAFAFAALAASLITANPVMAVAGLFAVGVGLAGIFPTVLAEAAELVPDRFGTVSGWLFAASTLGGLLFPPAIGALATALESLKAGLLAGLALLAGVAALMLGVQFSRGRRGFR